MSSVNYIVANYLKVLGIQEPTITAMLNFLENHPKYPSLRSIVETFEEWQFGSTAATATIEQLKSLGGFFIAYLHEGGGAFVFVIRTESEQIIYLNSIGEIIYELYEQFGSKWSNAIFIAELEEGSGFKRNNAEDYYAGDRVSLQQLKKVAFNQEEPYTYKFFRRFSIFFSYVFVRLGIGPNVISSIWMVSLIAASWLLSTGTGASVRFLAAGLICLHFLLDCADGEVARAKKLSSRIGSYYEQTIHWTTNLCLIVGISWGLFNQTGSFMTLLLGLLCLVSDSCFHFIYIQLSYWINNEVDYGWFHKITKAIYTVMPLNINLFLLGCLFNQLYVALFLWFIISSGLFILLSVGFFRKEFLLFRKVP